MDKSRHLLHWSHLTARQLSLVVVGGAGGGGALKHCLSNVLLIGNLTLTDSLSCCLWTAKKACINLALSPSLQLSVTDVMTGRRWFAVMFRAEKQSNIRLLLDRILNLLKICVTDLGILHRNNHMLVMIKSTCDTANSCRVYLCVLSDWPLAEAPEGMIYFWAQA